MAPRVVVDTGIIVSGALKAGIPRKIWLAFRENHCRFVLSLPMFREVNEVLHRPKFHHLIDGQMRKEIIRYLELFAEFVNPSETITLCRDPKDNKILEAAIAARADAIIASDKDLKSMKTIRDIPILTPREFMNFFKL